MHQDLCFMHSLFHQISLYYDSMHGLDLSSGIMLCYSHALTYNIKHSNHTNFYLTGKRLAKQASINGT